MKKPRAIIFGKHPDEITDLVLSKGFEIVDENETADKKNQIDIVISYGGDGTFLLSEARYPGIPKLLLKSSAVCKLCEDCSHDKILDSYVSGKYIVKKIPKLEATAGGTTLQGVNDIIVHNTNPRHAIRYHVDINAERIPNHEIIGDGVVIATPLGSTGYYRSITDGFFTAGIGLAFNNSTEQSEHVVLDAKDEIKISITRGPAFVYADNQETSIELQTGDIVTIKISTHEAELIRTNC